MCEKRMGQEYDGAMGFWGLESSHVEIARVFLRT
jgi:hypothetical protein